MAESHKTLQAKMCDILFPCRDQATSDTQEKLRTGVCVCVGGGGGCKDLSCQKKKRLGAREEYDHGQDRGNGTIMLQKNNLRKKNFATGAKILRLS